MIFDNPLHGYGYGYGYGRVPYFLGTWNTIHLENKTSFF